MTYSIIARDPSSKIIVIGIASRLLAVGSKCIFAHPGKGCVIIQSYINQALGIIGLTSLTKTENCETTLESIFKADENKSLRQVSIMDNHGNTTTHTGEQCPEIRGSLNRNDICVTGNYLANDRVIPNMYKAFNESSSTDFVEKVFDAMYMAENIGGDARGPQSAALYIIGQSLSERLFLHVDDHPTPIKELHRIFKINDEMFSSPVNALPE